LSVSIVSLRGCLDLAFEAENEGFWFQMQRFLR